MNNIKVWYNPVLNNIFLVKPVIYYSDSRSVDIFIESDIVWLSNFNIYKHAICLGELL